jgi:hypothetical protein
MEAAHRRTRLLPQSSSGYEAESSMDDAVPPEEEGPPGSLPVSKRGSMQQMEDEAASSLQAARRGLRQTSNTIVFGFQPREADERDLQPRRPSPPPGVLPGPQ